MLLGAGDPVTVHEPFDPERWAPALGLLLQVPVTLLLVAQKDTPNYVKALALGLGVITAAVGLKIVARKN